LNELIALNFDNLCTPVIKLKESAADPAAHPSGFGWYPNDDYAAVVIKDHAGKGSQTLAQAMNDWSHFRSTLFLCKVRGATRRHTQHDAQPFRRSFAGRDWLFLHNGSLDKEGLSRLYNKDSHFLEPLGNTDSELAFCYLLDRFQSHRLKQINEVEGHTLLEWMAKLDTVGSADIIMTDGRSLVVYRSTKQTGMNLAYARFSPADRPETLDSASARLDFNDSRDQYRTALMVTTSTFNQGNWQPLMPGQLIVARRAAILWNSHADEEVTSAQSPLSPAHPDVQEKSPFDSQQVAQPQTTQTVINIKAITHTQDGTPLAYRMYDVLHQTEYEYSKPVEHSTHTFRLNAVEDNVQEVIQATLEISVPGERLYFEDVFGNQSIQYTINQDYKVLQIRSQSRIKVYACPPDDFSSPLRNTSIPLVWMPWQRQMMSSYLLPPELPETQLRELTDFAMSFVERNDYNLLETLLDLNKRIYEDFEYKQGSTSLETTPFDVFASRAGVCQDFANLFICLSRLLGVPARYRVGYIYTGGNYENKVQSEASHAWVEVYLPFIGWRGLDPTNGCTVAQDHIRVACGRNYRDATPTSGTILKGGGDERLMVHVQMTEVNP